MSGEGEAMSDEDHKSLCWALLAWRVICGGRYQITDSAYAAAVARHDAVSPWEVTGYGPSLKGANV